MIDLIRGRAAVTQTLLAVAFAVGPLSAQGVNEFGIQAIGTIADRSFGGVGPYLARRLTERARLCALLFPGVSEGDFAFRGEVLGNLLLRPRRDRGLGLYGLGGLALVTGPTTQGYLVIGVGLESRPGARTGWTVELGVGGGVRISAGFRWRRFPAGWSPER